MEVSKLQEICNRMLEIKEVIAEYDAEKKLLNAELTELKLEMVEHLDEHGLRSFDHGNGKISLTERRSVKMVDKYKFFEWLKRRGELEEVVSVAAPRLNKIYKDELEAAIEDGNVDFLEKGLEEFGVSKPNVYRDIRFLD
ncbi:MAG: hypothetical protein GY861_17780 [bacterium]|nr:hypothetical protein [bacterium]